METRSYRPRLCSWTVKAETGGVSSSLVNGGLNAVKHFPFSPCFYLESVDTYLCRTRWSVLDWRFWISLRFIKVRTTSADTANVGRPGESELWQMFVCCRKRDATGGKWFWGPFTGERILIKRQRAVGDQCAFVCFDLWMVVLRIFDEASGVRGHYWLRSITAEDHQEPVLMDQWHVYI